MHIITRNRFNQFADRYPQSRSGLPVDERGLHQGDPDAPGIRRGQVEKITMLNAALGEATAYWPLLANVVSVPHTEEEYCQLVGSLDTLIDEVGENEAHPLAHP